MDVDDLIGAKLVVGFPGPQATEELIAVLRATHAQSLIVFEQNFVLPEQFTGLLRRLEGAVGRRLLVMVDHEGGRVVRFSSGVTRFPDPLTAGRTGSPDAARHQGLAEAKELRALGVDLNLAPVVDVLVEGSDPIIGPRSYGTDPARVAEMASARIRGLQEGGVAACAKHFPGLGAVPRDPHRHLPTVDLDWEAMKRVHLPPFVSAVDAGVASIMSSHVCYPKLDPAPSQPATFSARLMQGLLREELGFDGVVLTDDLEMGAVRGLCSMGEAAIRAAKAGHDLLLVCWGMAAQRETFEALCGAYRQQRLSANALEQSVQRINRLRQRLGKTPFMRP